MHTCSYNSMDFIGLITSKIIYEKIFGKIKIHLIKKWEKVNSTRRMVQLMALRVPWTLSFSHWFL